MDILLSTAYLPCIEYMAAIIAADEVFIENHETYSRQTYRNRCHIAGPGGLQSLSIPVERPEGNHTPMDQVLTSNQSPWQRIHWKSIETAYSKSAFFMYYKDELEPHFTNEAGTLANFNFRLLQTLLLLFRIDKPVLLTNHYEHTPSGCCDLREKISPKKPGLLPMPYTEYFQPFASKYGFLSNLSTIDLLFAEGPHGYGYLLKISEKLHSVFKNLC